MQKKVILNVNLPLEWRLETFKKNNKQNKINCGGGHFIIEKKPWPKYLKSVGGALDSKLKPLKYDCCKNMEYNT